MGRTRAPQGRRESVTPDPASSGLESSSDFRSESSSLLASGGLHSSGGKPPPGGYGAAACSSADSAPLLTPVSDLPPRGGRLLRLRIGLFTGCLLGGCCIAIMIPFFPLEVARRGGSHTMSCVVFSSYALTQLVSFPLAGRLLPVLGVTRAFSGGLALAGTTTIIFGMLPVIESTEEFIALCVVMRVGEAVGASCLQTAARTMAATHFAGASASALGLIETGIALGMSVGQGVGGGLYAVGGYGAPFYVVGSGMILVAVFCVWVFPVLDKGDVVTVRRPAGWLLSQARSPETWACAVVVMVVSMNWTSIDPNLAPYVEDKLSMQPAELSLYLLGSSGCYSLASLAWGKIGDRYSNTYLITCSCLLLAGTGILFMLPAPFTGLAPSRALFCAGMLVRQVAQGGAYVPLIGRQLGKQQDLASKAAISAAIGLLFAAGSVVGPVAGGRIADLYGMVTTGAVQAGLDLLAAVLAASMAVVLYRTAGRTAPTPWTGADST